MFETEEERMTKKLFIAVCAFFTVAFSLHAQWSQTVMNVEVSRLLREAKSGFLPNGCGPAGSPEALVSMLNALGRYNACSVHDRDYENLDMTKAEADRRLYDNLVREGVPRYLAAIFYTAVSSGGQTAWERAQAQMRRKLNKVVR
jgi:hypothetical protein